MGEFCFVCGSFFYVTVLKNRLKLPFLRLPCELYNWQIGHICRLLFLFKEMLNKDLEMFFCFFCFFLSLLFFLFFHALCHT